VSLLRTFGFKFGFAWTCRYACREAGDLVCYGSTDVPEYRRVLLRLAQLPFVNSIEQAPDDPENWCGCEVAEHSRELQLVDPNMTENLHSENGNYMY
jgi:hypothetical protein